MDIFSKIEGLSGENLGSALLGYLIFNSNEIRDSIISLLSDKSPVGPISYASHFACRTEYPTTHAQFGNGRLDVLIELDDVVIGIENKFFASFQDNQPHKYLETLESVRSALESINHLEVRALLFVFCPEARKADARERTKELSNASIVTWEEILEQLAKVDAISNPLANVVKNQFIQYLKRHFSFIHDFERKTAHFRRVFPDYGSPLQYELVAKLWSLFPKPGPRLSKGKSWLGYYFFNDAEINEKGWFGFVRSGEIEHGTPNEAELIIATTYRAALPKEFEPVVLKTSDFIGEKKRTTYAWAIKFDSGWNNIEKWREKLAPLWGAIHADAD